jgi:hypothetical protein
MVGVHSGVCFFLPMHSERRSWLRGILWAFFTPSGLDLVSGLARSVCVSGEVGLHGWVYGLEDIW